MTPSEARRRLARRDWTYAGDGWATDMIAMIRSSLIPDLLPTLPPVAAEILDMAEQWAVDADRPVEWRHVNGADLAVIDYAAGRQRTSYVYHVGGGGKRDWSTLRCGTRSPRSFLMTRRVTHGHTPGSPRWWSQPRMDRRLLSSCRCIRPPLSTRRSPRSPRRHRDRS